MRVIVTRPEYSARRTARRLAELGHVPVMLPLFRPVHDPDAIERALATPHRAIAVTSAEAVRALAGIGPRLERYRDETVFAVGSATASMAQAAGFGRVLSSQGGGLELAGLIASHVNGATNTEGEANLPLLYLAGSPRSPAFERQLLYHDIRFCVVECYRMTARDHEADALHRLLHDQPVDAVLFYSRETARQFFRLPSVAEEFDPSRRCIFFCLSANVAGAIPQMLRDKAVVSPNPDEESLLDLLCRCQKLEN